MTAEGKIFEILILKKGMFVAFLRKRLDLFPICQATAVTCKLLNVQFVFYF